MDFARAQGTPPRGAPPRRRREAGRGAPPGRAKSLQIQWAAVSFRPPGAGRFSRRRRAEHFQQKACPGLDPGWEPVFRPKMRPRKKDRSAFSFRRN